VAFIGIPEFSFEPHSNNVSPVFQKRKFVTENLMKIDVYSLLPDSVKDYIAEEISEALVKNGHDNSIVLWDISCELPNEV